MVIALTKKTRRTVLLLLLGLTGAAAVFILNIILGSVNIPLSEVFHAFSDSVDKTVYHKIITDIRLPRASAALIGGSALAVSGILLQVFFSNPIVEPYVLGISSGASLFTGMVILIGFRLGIVSLSNTGMFLGAFVGAMAVSAIVVLASQNVKSITTLLIIGMMFGYVCSAAISIMTAFADRERLASFVIWTMGSFSGFSWQQTTLMYIVILPFILLAFLLSKPLNIMLLGEEYARSMGISIKPFRAALITVSGILCAAVTAFAGPISFIGLAVPHIVRLIFGTQDNRIIIPASCLYGAIMSGICDLASRTLLPPYELPLGAMTSVIGAPILVFLLLNKRGKEGKF
ncbi:MAG: FecCD family ABC transporter permease [Eubacteriales bacterium]|jgi:iron complex transport system permease protein